MCVSVKLVENDIKKLAFLKLDNSMKKTKMAPLVFVVRQEAGFVGAS